MYISKSSGKNWRNSIHNPKSNVLFQCGYYECTKGRYLGQPKYLSIFKTLFIGTAYHRQNLLTNKPELRISNASKAFLFFFKCKRIQSCVVQLICNSYAKKGTKQKSESLIHFSLHIQLRWTAKFIFHFYLCK